MSNDSGSGRLGGLEKVVGLVLLIGLIFILCVLTLRIFEWLDGPTLSERMNLLGQPVLITLVGALVGVILTLVNHFYKGGK